MSDKLTRIALVNPDRFVFTLPHPPLFRASCCRTDLFHAPLNQMQGELLSQPPLFITCGGERSGGKLIQVFPRPAAEKVPTGM